jgi:integrase
MPVLPSLRAPYCCPCSPDGRQAETYKNRAEVNWHATAAIDKSGLYRVVTTRARIAGLGHVAPHDLRRSAAAILHNSTTDDGAHHFDLLDIQRVLEPMDSKTNNRAAGVLD